MATRYAAGASGLPFGVLRGYVGTDLPTHTATIKPIECPFTGEVLTAVPALNPDVGDHPRPARRPRRQRADLGPASACRRRRCWPPRRSIVTVEEIVDELTPTPGRDRAAELGVDAVCHVPGGAHPSFAMGFSIRDNAFYQAWDAIANDRDTFTAWIDQHILSTADFAEYRARSVSTTSSPQPVNEGNPMAIAQRP